MDTYTSIKSTYGLTMDIIRIIDKLTSAFPYAILISILASIGSITQKIIIMFFNSDESNLYDTVNGGLIRISQAGFVEWLTSYYYFLLFIFPALLIVMIGVNGETSKKKFIRILFLTFLTLMVIDYFYFICEDEYYNWLSNTISNLIGSIAISAIVILSFDTGYTINNYFEVHQLVYRKLIHSVVAILFGLIIAFMVYIVEKNIYSVTTSKIDLTVKLPINGYYNAKSTKEENKDSSYGLFSSKTSNIQEFSWEGAAENFSLEWKKKVNTHSELYKCRD